MVRKQWDLPGKISSTLWGKEDERDQGIKEEAVGPARPNKLGPSSTTGESGYSDAGKQPADAVGERDDPRLILIMVWRKLIRKPQHLLKPRRPRMVLDCLPVSTYRIIQCLLLDYIFAMVFLSSQDD